MKVSNGVATLELTMNVMGTQNIIHPTMTCDNNTVVLVDAGYPGQLPQIREAMEKAGVSFDRLSKVIITHHDMDHMGSLSSIQKELAENVEVLAHEKEKPYIQGEKPATKVTQLEARLNSLSVEMKAMYESLKASYVNYKAKVDKTVADGEELPYCGGITVIYTPGHTPGHISLYLKQSKTLIASDALLIDGGLLVPAPQYINFDQDLAIKSLKKFIRYDIEKVICYHGGVYDNNINQSIADLADR